VRDGAAGFPAGEFSLLGQAVNTMDADGG